MKKVLFVLLAALGSVLCNAQNITIIKTTDGKQYAVKTGNMEEQGFFEVESYSAPEEVHDTIYIEVHDTIYIDTKFSYTHAVDLGLPSGTKWADMNVGAENPEDYGWYLAWGETKVKSTYNWSTYKLCNGSSSNMTKYSQSTTCWDSYLGTSPDQKTVLDPEDDAAHVNWGGKWRMPTKAEQDELRSKCTWKWGKKNGVDGYTVKGPNGNTIFLPASGYHYGNTSEGVGSYGYYWSSSLDSDNSGYAYYLNFFSEDLRSEGNHRTRGLNVRPVCQ